MKPVFLKFLLTLPSTLDQISSQSHGGTMGIINSTIMKNFEVIVPDIKSQEEFIGYLIRINNQKEQLENSFLEIKYLYNSILNKAFKGEIFQE